MLTGVFTHSSHLSICLHRVFAHHQLALSVCFLVQMLARAQRLHSEQGRQARLKSYRLSLTRAVKAFHRNLSSTRIPDTQVHIAAARRLLIQRQRNFELWIVATSEAKQQRRAIRAAMQHSHGLKLSSTFAALCRRRRRRKGAHRIIVQALVRLWMYEWRAEVELRHSWRHKQTGPTLQIRHTTVVGLALQHWYKWHFGEVDTWYGRARAEALWMQRNLITTFSTWRDTCAEQVCTETDQCKQQLCTWRRVTALLGNLRVAWFRAVALWLHKALASTIRMWREWKAGRAQHIAETRAAFTHFGQRQAAQACVNMIDYARHCQQSRSNAAAHRIHKAFMALTMLARSCVGIWRHEHLRWHQAIRPKPQDDYTEQQESLANTASLEEMETRLRWYVGLRQQHRQDLAEQRRLQLWIATQGIGLTGTPRMLQAQSELRQLQRGITSFKNGWDLKVVEIRALQHRIEQKISELG